MVAQGASRADILKAYSRLGADEVEQAGRVAPFGMVLVDGQWVTGELRAWIRDGDGWDAYVQYRTKPGQNYLARFHAEHIRQADPPVDDAPQHPRAP